MLPWREVCVRGVILVKLCLAFPNPMAQFQKVLTIDTFTLVPGWCYILFQAGAQLLLALMFCPANYTSVLFINHSKLSLI